MPMISILQDRPFRADAEPYERFPASSGDEGVRFYRGLLVALGLSVLIYAGLGGLVLSMLN